MEEDYWITGIYQPAGRGNWNWVTFSYGPFPNRESCQARADDRDAMIKALGTGVKKFEIDCTDPLRYSQACKHFEETIKSEHFDSWYEKRWEAS